MKKKPNKETLAEEIAIWYCHMIKKVSQKLPKTKKIKKVTNLVVIKPTKKPNLPTKTKQKIRDAEKQKILTS
ncbi:7133_t:CDS:2 [Funneliformis geosporum]|nr:7133_t:CDS:2 [Funneliformis geosporum]